MNREKAKTLLPIITAFAEGKTIQYRPALEYEWCDTTNPTFCYSPSAYRVKPEPKKIYLIRRGGGSVVEARDDFNIATATYTKLQAQGAFKPYTLEEYVQVLEGDKS